MKVPSGQEANHNAAGRGFRSCVSDIEEAAVDFVAKLLQPVQEFDQIFVQAAAENYINAAEAQTRMKFAGTAQRLAGIRRRDGLEDFIRLFHAGMQGARHVTPKDQ